MNTNKTNITITRSAVETFERVMVQEIATSTFSAAKTAELILGFQDMIWSLKELLDMMAQIPDGIILFADKYEEMRSRAEEYWAYYPIEHFAEKHSIEEVVKILQFRRNYFREVFPILRK
jgi:hypothetical protein